jgi:RNA recognition motif-containing protein
MGARLYVGNLSFSTTEDTLRAALEEGGRTVKDIHMVTDRETGRPRGFAFAEMSSDAEAQSAIESLDGNDLDGRTLTVNEAKPRTDGGGGGRRW